MNKSRFYDVHLWINGGVDLKEFDLNNKEQFDAAIGTIDDYYDECII